jgi:V/A-type H+-transporting ATPase subunit D
MKLVDKAQMLRSSIESTYSEAYKALQEANMSLGVVSTFARCVPIENGITVSSQSVMGVELPAVELEKKPPKIYYGFARTNSTLDRAYIAFEKVKEMTAVLAEVENGIYRLSVAIRKTQRRANALQNIIIPRNKDIVKYITDSLEEKIISSFYLSGKFHSFSC